MPKTILLDTPERFQEALEIASARLLAGDVVVVPTETVYGLAANALDQDAVAKIYRIKNRPDHNPLIVHISGLKMAQRYAASWPAEADRLARSFWPGPLTLVVNRPPSIPEIVTAGGSTVALRWPKHPFMDALIDKSGIPLAAPSANLANSLSPTTAQHVSLSLEERVDLIIDGGGCRVGIESTVVDVTQDPPRVLRPGVLSPLDLGAAHHPSSSSSVPKSPGQGSKHYAPKAKLVLLDHWQEAKEWLRTMNSNAVHAVVRSEDWIENPSLVVHRLPMDPDGYGREIYAALHQCDQRGAEWILIERPPNQPAWEGILDRLIRGSYRDPASD